MSVPQLFSLAAVEIIGDFSLKEYANNGGITYLALGVFGYIGVVALLIASLEGSTVLLVNNGWDAMSSIIESIAAFVFLGERFEHFSQYVGIFLVLIGTYLLRIPWVKKKVVS